MNEKTKLQKAKGAAAKALLGPSYPNNVIGVGIGNKFKNKKDTGTPCVRIYVLSKLDVDKLSPPAAVPRRFLGVPTDVIEVGRYGRTGKLENLPPLASTIGPGCAIRVAANVPNVNSGAFGTLGAVVSDSGGKNYILSCNHILSANGRVPENANILSNEELVGSFSGNQYYVELERGGLTNKVDCALGGLTSKKVCFDMPEEFDPLKKCKVVSSAPIKPERGMKVAKAGAISGTTSGTIVDVDAEGYIDYSFGTFGFVNQVVIDSGSDDKEFAVMGDSGSVAWDQETGRPTAMIFAAAGRFAVACPLTAVLKALEDAMRTSDNPDPHLTLRIGEPESKRAGSGAK